MQAAEFRIREAVDADAPYVLSSWLKNYRSSKITRGISSEVFFDQGHGHHAVVTRLLGCCQLRVACGESIGQILGWICFDDGVLHYIHVKRELQGFGVAHALLAAAGFNATKEITVTHWNGEADKAKSLGAKLIYNPYLLMV